MSQDLKILGKIDLSQFDKYQKPKAESPAYIKGFLGDLAKNYNQELGAFLQADGTIDMKSQGLETETLKNDEDLVKDRENEWATNLGKTREEWLEAKEKNPSNLAEIAITAVLYRALKDRFIIARASKYDDYENGIDNILVDKKTGALVCGLDEVIGHDGDDGGNKKREKILKTYRKDGVKIKYGFTMEEGKLVRKSFANVPAFYLSLSKEDLNDLIKGVNNNPEKISTKEINILKKLITSLEDQVDNIENTFSEIDPKLEANFNNFKNSLDIIRVIVESYEDD